LSTAGAQPKPTGELRRGGLAAIHTVIITPGWSGGIGSKFDPKQFVRLCQDAGVEVVEFYSKNALGHAMFPFRGRPCPCDWVSETRRLAADARLPFIIYYNIGLDNWIAERHPEWACVDAGGKPRYFADTFNWICIRSPWRDMVLDELRQIQQAVQPDGFWFDLTGAPNSYGGSLNPDLACYCRYCRAAFRDRYGRDLTAAPADPKQRLQVYELAESARLAMLADAMAQCRAANPEVGLSYNHAGDFWEQMVEDEAFPKVRRQVTLGSLEAKAHEAISLRAKLLWNQRKPYQLHSYGAFQRMQPGSASGTWVDWNLIPSTYLATSAAITTAHAGRFTVGVNLVPDGTLYASEFENIRRTFQPVREREAWLAGLESVPNIGIIYDPRAELAGRRATPAAGMIAETTGLHNALHDSGLHFDVVRPGEFRPSDYRALLVGEAVYLRPGLEGELRAFVQAGGLLIVTGETSLRDEAGVRRKDFAWGDLLGVRFAGESPFREANYGWVHAELREAMLDYPILFTCPVFEIECTAARPLAELGYPEAHRTATTFLWETKYNQFKSSTGKPLVTVNPIGRGQVVYIAAPIGEQIASRADVWLKRLLVNAIRKYATGLVPDMIVPAGVQVVYGRRPGAHVLSLVNLYAGADPAPGRPVPRVGPVQARIAMASLGAAPVSVEGMDISGLKWQVRAETLEISAESIGLHGVVVIRQERK